MNKNHLCADTPINDLKLFQDMMAYLDVNQKVAEIVLQKLGTTVGTSLRK